MKENGQRTPSTWLFSLCDGSSEGRHTALVNPTGQDGNLSERSARHVKGWQGEGLRTGSLMLCGYSALPKSIGEGKGDMF